MLATLLSVHVVTLPRTTGVVVLHHLFLVLGIAVLVLGIGIGIRAFKGLGLANTLIRQELTQAEH